MHIIQLGVENFKRIKAVEIRPDGAVQIIEGRNAQGKTSVLDAIASALGGKKLSPDRPVRDGEKHAEVSVDLGDKVVRRKWTADGKSTLTVEGKRGETFKSPQTLLDELIGDLSFDPLAFLRSDKHAQAAMLRQIAGLDTTLLDGQRQTAYDKRTEAARAWKAEVARLDAMPEVDAPDDPVSVKALLTELDRAEQLGREWEAVRRKSKEIERDLIAAQAYERQAKQELERARRARDDVELKLIAAKEAAEAQPFSLGGDPLEIRDRLNDAEATNEKVRAKKARAEQTRRTASAHAEYVKHERAIEEIDARKAELLAGARFPVPGLSIDGNTPTFNGVPLAQASGAEQLRVSLAVAGALNPKLKVLLVRDGSLLDSESLKLVAEWAEQNGAQLWIERVADGPSGAGVLIEDGQVVEPKADPSDFAPVA